MSAKRQRADNLLATSTFWIGMSFILSAPIMNLAYERMCHARVRGDGSEVLPEFLATLYNTGGQMGVTVFLLTIGVAILIFGYLRQRPKSRSVVSQSTANSVPHALRDSAPDEPNQVSTVSGHMVLQTRKYLP